MLDRSVWNEKVITHTPLFGAFLQSYEWGLFQLAMGRDVRRVYKETAEGIFLAQCINISLGYGFTYTTIPKGPLGTYPENDIFSELRVLSDKSLFIRTEPVTPSSLMRVPDVQPSATILIDLQQSMDTLYNHMKPKTRYNIRLGERKGVVVRDMHATKDFDTFWFLMQQTATRDRIRLYPVSYYKTLLKAMSQKQGAQAKLVGAFYKERLLAVNVIVDFGGVRTYLYGATSNVHRNVMAQYVLHATLIEEAKQAGMHTFDFWGVVSQKEEDAGHKWAGISRYKRSFGGTYVEMPGTFDFVMHPLKYELYRLLRKVKRVL